jgi:4-methyl-5(b-hydroxyethyl)-thiazole monophosphate biosynthesis
MRVAIFLAEGFELCEALITVDILRRGQIAIDTVSIHDDLLVKSSQRVEVQADLLYKDIDVATYDVLVFPGGKLGTQNLEAFAPVVNAMKSHFESGKLSCAICAAPSILGHQGILKGRKYTCFPSFDDPSYGGFYQNELAVKDGNLITGRGMGATIEFARLILMQLVDEDAVKKVEYGMQYEHSFRELSQ